jgi:hypothetical protein
MTGGFGEGFEAYLVCIRRGHASRWSVALYRPEDEAQCIRSIPNLYVRESIAVSEA